MTTRMPEINSLWMDKTSGDYLYKYKGSNKRPSIGHLYFVRVDFKTGEESGGGLWLGHKRFLEDMISEKTLSKNPCCGHPTQYPSVWCYNCGYNSPLR